MTDMSDLEKKLGFVFKNRSLLTESLTHRSYLNENPKFKESNERLEFLGDSVLSLLTSTKLFKLFPTFPEGQLTNLRSNLVRAATLARVSQALGLGNYLLLSRGEEKSDGRKNESLLADLFEAVLGAIYLDHGIKTASEFLEKHLFPLIPAANQETSIFDYKSRLQEKTQEQTQISPQYKVVAEVGPDHNKVFTVAVFLQDRLLAQGSGKSKQEAQQEAARIALEGLR